MMMTLWPPLMPRPPTTGVVGSLMVQSFVLSRVKLWCAPVFATLRVAQAWLASPQAGGRQVSSEPGPGAGVAVGVGVGVGAGVGVGVGLFAFPLPLLALPLALPLPLPRVGDGVAVLL